MEGKIWVSTTNVTCRKDSVWRGSYLGCLKSKNWNVSCVWKKRYGDGVKGNNMNVTCRQDNV